MASTKVKLTLPTFALGNSTCDFDVFKDDSKIGTLQISKGSLRWTPANGQTPKRKSWKELKEFFES